MNDQPSVAKRDTFADIASQQRLLWNEQLVQPEPARFDGKVLPRMAPASGPAPRMKAIDTPEKLDRALAQLRATHSRFLANHAPALEGHRDCVQLETFGWRLETPADRQDFSHVLNGGGDWLKVSVPHYGPPEGRATAYYRTDFQVTASMLAKGSLYVRFRGVDYKAHVFVNGGYVGSHEGFFAPFEFECSGLVQVGVNHLVVKVENDAIMMGNGSWDGPSSRTSGDKLYAATGPGYDDPEVGWHHCPPAMGIYQPVSIEARARLHVSDLFVRPLPAEASAEAWLEVSNCDVAAKNISVEVSVCGRNFKKAVCERRSWQPKTVRVPGLSDMDKPCDNQVIGLMAEAGVNYFKIPIALPGFRWWTPEAPWLYQVQIRLVDGSGVTVDAAERQFGMRTFEIDEATEPKGTLRLNGREIRLRGANTMGFEQLAVMRKDWDRLRDDILLAKLCHMNFLRLTQRPVQEEVYDWCDRLGLMTQTDLPLFGVLRRNQFTEALRQVGELERLVRSHPCNVVVSYINEPFPNADASPHRHLTRPELTEFFKAADVVVRQMNPDRMIKPVDGDYDPPAPGLPDIHCYNGWYLSNGVGLGELHKGFWQKVKPGWNYACGEFGAEGIDDEATMRRYYPKSWLPQAPAEEADWTPSRIRKAQTGSFYHMWFERPETLKGWIAASQAHQAWTTKLMTEAFRRNPRMVSFAMHHYIDAFPAGWMKAIMDVDRRPKPAFFAYRDALTPLMVSLRTDRVGFYAGERVQIESWICNDLEDAPSRAELRYALVRGGRVLRKGRANVRVPKSGPSKAGLIPVEIPEPMSGEPVVLRVSLVGPGGALLHENELGLRVFERPEGAPALVRVVGPKGGEADRLAREMGLKRTKDADIWIVDGYDGLTKRQQAEIAKAVSDGAHAVLLNLKPGEHAIGGDRILVQRSAMGPRHFAARVRGSRLTGDFEAEDFKFWYDQDLDRPSPILDSMFTASSWEPILTSGNPGSGTDWVTCLAVGTKRHGRGRWTVSQLSLSGRIEGNPAAEVFARRLIAPADLL